MSRRDYILIQAGYDLVTDDLLDLSHVNVPHDGLLGNAEAIVAEINMRVDGETVSDSRFSTDVPVPRVFDLSFRQDGRNVDTWTDMRWHVPACLRLEAEVTEPGTGRARGTAVVGIHLLTPETSLRTHYHIAAVLVDPPVGSPERELRIRDQVSRYRRTIFETQDAPMIAEQQRRILSSRDSPRPASLAIDAGRSGRGGSWKRASLANATQYRRNRMSEASQLIGRRPGVVGIYSLDHFALQVPDMHEASPFYDNFGLETRARGASTSLGRRRAPLGALPPRTRETARLPLVRNLR